MHKIKKKLRSERGASISFSLLLFLVCAVVGSLVLNAGQTSSGRISRMLEMDQRYFAVTSATELLKKQIEGEKIEIIRTETETVVKDYKTTIDKDTGSTSTVSTQSTPTLAYETKVISINGVSNKSQSYSETPSDLIIASGTVSFLTILATKHMFGEGKCNTQDAFAASFENPVSGDDKTFEFEFQLPEGSSESIKNSIKVNGTYSMKENGDLVFVVSSNYSKNASNTTDKYALELIMKAVKTSSSVNAPASVTTGNKTYNTDGSTEIKQTTIYTRTKTDTIEWKFESLKKA